MPSVRPVIALLTDFGTRDHYAGALKGVALEICPDATLIDIAHDLPAHDVMAGALELAASARRGEGLPPKRAASGSWRPTTVCSPSSSTSRRRKRSSS
jgi:hypothetical protein